MLIYIRLAFYLLLAVAFCTAFLPVQARDEAQSNPQGNHEEKRSTAHRQCRNVYNEMLLAVQTVDKYIGQSTDMSVEKGLNRLIDQYLYLDSQYQSTILKNKYNERIYYEQKTKYKTLNMGGRDIPIPDSVLQKQNLLRADAHICVLRSLLGLPTNITSAQGTSQTVSATPPPSAQTETVSLSQQRANAIAIGVSSMTSWDVIGVKKGEARSPWVYTKQLEAIDKFGNDVVWLKGFSNQQHRASVKRMLDYVQRQCSQVAGPDHQNCLKGTYFGAPEPFSRIERALAEPPPEKLPKLKRQPTDAVNQCLTLETAGLFGGFKNSCDFSVMVVWCVESPPKDSWSDSFRCVNRSKANALDIVGPQSRITAHTRSGNVVIFACAWQSKTGPGPDGIWGEAIYNEGVGTPGIMRGTCGEQVLVP